MQPRTDEIARAAVELLQRDELTEQVDWDPSRARLRARTHGGVTHYIDLRRLAARWADARPERRQFLLEGALLAVRRAPERPILETLQHRVVLRLRPRAYLSALELRRKVLERVEGESAEDITLPHRVLTEQLGVQLMFELTDAPSEISDRHLRAWGVDFDTLFRFAMDRLRATAGNPLGQIKPGLYGSSASGGHDAARLLMPETLTALALDGPVVAMAPHPEVILVAGAHDDEALVEMARLGVDLSQQQLGLPAVAMQLGPAGWRPWLPEPSRRSHYSLKTAQLPGMLTAYEGQKQLMQAWHELEGDAATEAPFVISEADDQYFSVTVWTRGTLPPLLPRTDRIAFVIPAPRGKGEPKVYTLPWEEAEALPGVRLTLTDGYPPRWLAEGFPSTDLLTARIGR